MNTLPKEYTIDKNYIYKNPFEDLKELFKENEKIKLITNPKYVQIAFQVAKELNEENIATFDEELKIERDFKDSKRKTKIILSLKRKQQLNEYFIEKNYFYKNIFEEVKNYLKNHDKVTITAKREEVGMAFKVAKELVEKGIALYDEELKIERNFKAGQGKTKIYISLKKKPYIQEYHIKKNEESSEIIQNMRQLFKKNEKITMVALPGEIPTAFKASKKLIDEGIAQYDEELKIERNFKAEKGKTKAFISLKRRPVPEPSKNKMNINTISIQKNTDYDEIIKKSINLFEKNEKINLEVKSSEVGTAFKVAQELNNKGISTYDDELKIERNFKDDKGKTKIVISLKKKAKIKEYEIGKKCTNEKIVKDIKELFKEYDKIILVALKEKVGSAFTACKVLCEEGIAMYDDELKIKRNLKEGIGSTKACISIRKKIK